MLLKNIFLYYPIAIMAFTIIMASESNTCAIAPQDFPSFARSLQKKLAEENHTFFVTCPADFLSRQPQIVIKKIPPLTPINGGYKPKKQISPDKNS